MSVMEGPDFVSEQSPLVLVWRVWYVKELENTPEITRSCWVFNLPLVLWWLVALLTFASTSYTFCCLARLVQTTNSCRFQQFEHPCSRNCRFYRHVFSFHRCSPNSKQGCATNFTLATDASPVSHVGSKKVLLVLLTCRRLVEAHSSAHWVIQHESLRNTQRR